MDSSWSRRGVGISVLAPKVLHYIAVPTEVAIFYVIIEQQQSSVVQVGTQTGSRCIITCCRNKHHMFVGVLAYLLIGSAGLVGTELLESMGVFSWRGGGLYLYYRYRFSRTLFDSVGALELDVFVCGLGVVRGVLALSSTGLAIVGDALCWRGGGITVVIPVQVEPEQYQPRGVGTVLTR